MLLKIALLRVDILNLTVLLRDTSPVQEIVKVVVNIVESSKVNDSAPLSQIKVLSYKDKGDWTLESKYNIGKKKTTAS